jgi:hypothetical protein
LQLQEEIPEQLRPQAEAALVWFNQTHDHAFELTGLVDYEQALNADPANAYELGLVLCDGEVCMREQVRIEHHESGYEFSSVAAGQSDIPPMLDPPQHIRRTWLDKALKKHEFVLLLFYRGLW